MIYGNSIDTNDAPDPGWTGLCVNCRLDISGHKGWRCKAKIPVGLATRMAEHRFDKLWGADRFETPAMQAYRWARAGQGAAPVYVNPPPVPVVPPVPVSFPYVPANLAEARNNVGWQAKCGGPDSCQRHLCTVLGQQPRPWTFYAWKAQVCALCAVELHGGNIIDSEAEVQRMTAGNPVVVLTARRGIPNSLIVVSAPTAIPTPVAPALQVVVPKDLAAAEALVMHQAEYGGFDSCSRHSYITVGRTTVKEGWHFSKNAEVCGLCAVEMHGAYVSHLESAILGIVASRGITGVHLCVDRGVAGFLVMQGAGGQAHAAVTAKIEVDLEPSWRQWRDKNRAASDCACGIARTMCSYHQESL